EKPHDLMLNIQPFFLGALVFTDVALGGGSLTSAQLIWMIAINVVAFFLTALVCHGELARDRPSTKHLTEFYLLMSVGGAVGGVFNGLIAPLLFPGNWEYPLALIAACLVRPTMRQSGWVDDLVASYMESPPAAAQPKKGHKPTRPTTSLERSPSFHYTMDAVLAGLVLLVTLAVTFTPPANTPPLGSRPHDPFIRPASLIPF